MKPQSPQQPSLPEPIAAQLQFDDEVTSVSIAGSTSSRSSFEDDVVDSGATSSGMASWNDPVQEERLDLLRKSSQDALAGARKRHMERQARQRELIPFAEDDDATKSEPAPTPEPTSRADQEEPLAPDAERSSIFPPDDFVEEEKSTAEDDASLDDEMVDEGVSPNRNRSPRMRNLLREAKNPKKNEAMRMSMPSEMRVTSNNPDNREQWNSVPTLNPGFELPLNNAPAMPKSAPIKVAASAAPMASTSYQPRPVSQARELLSEDRLRHERSQRQMVAPIADEEAQPQQPRQSQSTSDRPRLTEAPAADARPIDRIKSSPLRGYHPATRKLNVPEPERREARQRPQQEQQAEPIRHQAPQRDARQHVAVTSERQAEPRPQRVAPVQQQREQRMARAEAPRAPQQDMRPAEHLKPRYEQERPYLQLHEVNEPFEREEIEISPNVPRCCGTCTSFQPGGVDGRGSCGNRFAGPVQRVVYEQDLACNHTFGSFWLPADEEVWLEELETNYPPTPRVDAMLARRRRRENPVLPDLEELTS